MRPGSQSRQKKPSDKPLLQNRKSQSLVHNPLISFETISRLYLPRRRSSNRNRTIRIHLLFTTSISSKCIIKHRFNILQVFCSILLCPISTRSAPDWHGTRSLSMEISYPTTFSSPNDIPSIILRTFITPSKIRGQVRSQQRHRGDDFDPSRFTLMYVSDSNSVG